MNTAHKTVEEKQEHFDSEPELESKATYLARAIKKSRHFVAFTGAGISTSAGVQDFRSGINTVIPTGPGAWEKAALNITKKSLLRRPMISAIPTLTHMALTRLQDAGYLKFLVTQNVDGLHRKSGFPSDKLAELHGNTNLEVCINKFCGKEYLRDYITRSAQDVKDHRTGRYCTNCGHGLHDNIINFGENLPFKAVQNGFSHCSKADFCLTLGTSLRVKPAVNMPRETVRSGGELAIVNLQSTPLDEQAFRVNGFVDDVMARLMDKLNLNIPRFTLKRRVAITKTKGDPRLPSQKGKTGILLKGIDEAGLSYSLFTEANVEFLEDNENVCSKDLDVLKFFSEKSDLSTGCARINLNFQGHYGEPPLTLDINLESLSLKKPSYYLLEFDPQIQKWIKSEQTLNYSS